MRTGSKLMEVYKLLLDGFGAQGWWPAATDEEMVIGAILTQNVAWKNVELAIANLGQAGVLSLAGIRELETDRLAELILPTRYYRVKAQKLKVFANYLGEHYNDNLERLFSQEWPQARRELLGLWGLGPETADSMLLYAGRQPVFVVDAYTRRIFSRLGFIPPEADYEATQALFMRHLPADQELFNEYHALIVRLGNLHCQGKNPRCGDCPLNSRCAWWKNI